VNEKDPCDFEVAGVQESTEKAGEIDLVQVRHLIRAIVSAPHRIILLLGCFRYIYVALDYRVRFQPFPDVNRAVR